MKAKNTVASFIMATITLVGLVIILIPYYVGYQCIKVGLTDRGYGIIIIWTWLILFGSYYKFYEMMDKNRKNKDETDDNQHTPSAGSPALS